MVMKNKHGWEIKKLKDICEKASSNISQNKIQENEGIYPIYGASGLIKYVDFYHQDKEYIGLIKDGAGVGRIQFLPPFSSVIGTLQYILPKNGNSIKYVAYCLRSLKLERFAQGAAIPHIYFKDYGEISIPVPPLPIQHQIVKELDTLSEIITKKEQQLEELDKLAQATFYDMFGDPVTNEKGWKKDSILNVAPIKSYKGELYSENEKFWLLNLDMIESNTGKILSVNMVDKDVVGNSTTTFSEENVLYSKLRPYLNKVVNPNKSGFATTELLPLLPKNGILNKIFLTHLLRSSFFVNYIQEKVAGAKMPRVSMDIFRTYNVILPPLTFQLDFAGKAELIEKQKSLIQQSITEVQQLLDYTMYKYFN